MCATCFGLYIGHPQACQYKYDMPEDGTKWNSLGLRNSRPKRVTQTHTHTHTHTHTYIYMYDWNKSKSVISFLRYEPTGCTIYVKCI